MNMKQLIDEFVAYAESDLFPKMNVFGQTAFLFAVGVLLDRNDLEEKMTLLGVVRDDGTVDLDRLESGMMFIFSKKDKPIDLGGFSFSRDDADEFIRRIRQKQAA